MGLFVYNHAIDAITKMHLLQKSGDLCDLTLTSSSGKQVKVHRLLYESCSEASLNTGSAFNRNELIYSGVSSEMLGSIVHFMYTGEIVLNQLTVTDAIRGYKELGLISAVRKLTEVSTLRTTLAEDVKSPTEVCASSTDGQLPSRKRKGSFGSSKRKPAAVRKKSIEGSDYSLDLMLVEAVAKESRIDRTGNYGGATVRRSSRRSNSRYRRSEEHFTDSERPNVTVDEAPKDAAEPTNTTVMKESEISNDEPTIESKTEDNPKSAKSGRKLLTCKLCNARFFGEKSRLTHMWKKHDIPLKENSRYKVLNCKESDCDYKTLEAFQLKQHMIVHSTNRPYCCEVCGKTFKNKNVLKTHKKHQHEDGNKSANTCPHCEKQFHSQPALHTHIQRIHEKHRRKCSQCDFGAYNKASIEEHMYKVHGVQYPSKVKVYKCEYCDYFTRWKNVYAIHIRRHKGEMPFECDVCNKRFPAQSDLTAHKKWHNDKKHKCPYEACKFATPLPSKLRDHLKRMHLQTGDKPFGCHECKYRSNIRGNLILHLRNVHKLNVVTAENRVKVVTNNADSAAESRSRIPYLPGLSLPKPETAPVPSTEQLMNKGSPLPIVVSVPVPEQRRPPSQDNFLKTSRVETEHHQTATGNGTLGHIHTETSTLEQIQTATGSDTLELIQTTAGNNPMKLIETTAGNNPLEHIKNTEGDSTLEHVQTTSAGNSTLEQAMVESGVLPPTDIDQETALSVGPTNQMVSSTVEHQINSNQPGIGGGSECSEIQNLLEQVLTAVPSAAVVSQGTESFQAVTPEVTSVGFAPTQLNLPNIYIPAQNSQMTYGSLSHQRPLIPKSVMATSADKTKSYVQRMGTLIPKSVVSLLETSPKRVVMQPLLASGINQSAQVTTVSKPTPTPGAQFSTVTIDQATLQLLQSNPGSSIVIPQHQGKPSLPVSVNDSSTQLIASILASDSDVSGQPLSGPGNSVSIQGPIKRAAPLQQSRQLSEAPIPVVVAKAMTSPGTSTHLEKSSLAISDPKASVSSTILQGLPQRVEIIPASSMQPNGGSQKPVHKVLYNVRGPARVAVSKAPTLSSHGSMLSMLSGQHQKSELVHSPSISGTNSEGKSLIQTLALDCGKPRVLGVAQTMSRTVAPVVGSIQPQPEAILGSNTAILSFQQLGPTFQQPEQGAIPLSTQIPSQGQFDAPINSPTLEMPQAQFLSVPLAQQSDVQTLSYPIHPSSSSIPTTVLALSESEDDSTSN